MKVWRKTPASRGQHGGIATTKWLVGGIPTPLKNMKINGKDYPEYINGK